MRCYEAYNEGPKASPGKVGGFLGEIHLEWDLNNSFRQAKGERYGDFQEKEQYVQMAGF